MQKQWANWKNICGKETINILPLKDIDNDRIFSADGTRSIRFIDHEMRSMTTKRPHFHYETWTYDPLTNTMTITNFSQQLKIGK
ncbi:hypothetical protein [Fusobacterium sp. PH5-44]|uniref:hypothetical protein n=1 Tax=unclassified Fusobacterium TaxID=2648384 RepID=UPI003D1C4725